MASDYTLILGDCLDKMSQIEDGSIDMICADLPYQQTNCAWDKMIPFEPLWKHYKRVIKRNGAIVLFGSGVFSFMLWASNPKWFKYEWIWHKNQVTGIGAANKVPMRSHENILIFYNNFPIFNKQPKQRISKGGKLTVSRGVQGSHNTVKNKQFSSPVPKRRFYNPEIVNPQTVLDFDCIPNGGGNRLHPTQKPVALLTYLIRTYTNEGETVLDNVFGSCSTGEACLREGRRFIGIEKDEGYYQIGVDRLARVAAELRGELNHLPMFAEVGA